MFMAKMRSLSFDVCLRTELIAEYLALRKHNKLPPDNSKAWCVPFFTTLDLNAFLIAGTVHQNAPGHAHTHAAQRERKMKQKART